MSDVSRLPAAPDRVAATRRAVAHAAGTHHTLGREQTGYTQGRSKTPA